MTVDQCSETLKKRLFTVRGLRPLAEIAEEIGITAGTLRNWIRGTFATKLDTINLIEVWVEQEERTQRDR